MQRLSAICCACEFAFVAGGYVSDRGSVGRNLALITLPDGEICRIAAVHYRELLPIADAICSGLGRR